MAARSKIVAALCAAVMLRAVGDGADYFVSKRGNDANDGTRRTLIQRRRFADTVSCC
jgi:hypothetical protein